MDTNFQRVGVISNAHAGREFEKQVQEYFSSKGLSLISGFKASIGYAYKKSHVFDLGSEAPAIILECKSYTWTSGGKSPSAKLRSLNEVMLLYSLVPSQYRKMLVMLKHVLNEKSLASHYIKTQGHLIPPGVEIWEFDPILKAADKIL